jgi:hypothetical protein
MTVATRFSTTAAAAVNAKIIKQRSELMYIVLRGKKESLESVDDLDKTEDRWVVKRQN